MHLVRWACGALLLAACAEPGERAASCDPFAGCPPDGAICPTGETCSDKTPLGLTFSGATPGDARFGGGAPLVTARGGTQTIRIDGLDGLRYQALVGGDTFTAIAGDGDTVALTGLADGSAYLRIVEPGTGLLYDRISLPVGEVASVAISESPLLWDTSAIPVVYWAPSSERLVVALHDAGGLRVADETMTYELPAEMVADPASWDCFTTSPQPPGDVAIGVTLGDGTPLPSAGARFVDQIDDVTLSASEVGGRPADGLAVGDWDNYIFRAERAGAAVYGAPYAATTDAPITAEASPGGWGKNWVKVTAVTIGTGHLTITAGTTSQEFDVPVHAAALAASRRTPTPAPAPASGALGERAQLVR